MKKNSILLIVIVLITTTMARAKTDQMKTDSLPFLDRPAPDFRLKDMNGNTVTLSSFRGKIVVIDFWATWCAGCHKAFPGIQKAITHYQKKNDVVFLFIDTRENTADIKKTVQNNLKQNGYMFTVLLDERGKDGKQNQCYIQYEMAGLPTKFIVDANGVIRYKLEGYAPWRSDEENKLELIKLIEDVRLRTTLKS